MIKLPLKILNQLIDSLVMDLLNLQRRISYGIIMD